MWGTMMKKFLLGTVGLVALSMAAGSASAADLAARPVYTKAPPMVAAVYDWSGFYIGINGGWGETHDSRFDVGTNFALGSFDANGGTIGGQVGYRWQTGAWVFGLEAQGNWADFSGSTVDLSPRFPNVAVRSKLDAFGLFTGQVGYAWNNVLLYVKGGAAVTDRQFDFFNNTTGLVAFDSGFSTQWSPTVGAGIEFGFAPNWSFGVEYDHIFENTHTVTFVNTATGVARTDGPFSSGGDTDMILGRLNYRFGGPVVARY
jgi:outer membrane immunogenic protein